MTRPNTDFIALLRQALKALLMGTLLFAVSLTLIFAAYHIFFIGRIFPGVSVAGVDVGGLTIQAAADKVGQQIQYTNQGQISLVLGDRTWQATPSQLGLYLDVQGSAKNAYQVGRTGSLVRMAAEEFAASYYGRSIGPAMILDERATYDYLNSIGAQINQPVQEASLSLQGTEVVVTPGQVGKYVDIYTTLPMITAVMQNLQSGPLPLATLEIQPEVLDASAQAEQARSILSQPLQLSLPEGQPDAQGPWTIEPQQLASMLRFEKVQQDGKISYQIAIDSNQLRQYLNDLAPNLTLTPANARFIFNDDTRQLEVIQPAVIGRVLNVDASLTAIQEKLRAGEHNIPLEFVFTDPQVTDTATGEQLGITELIHEETSYFYGSSTARVQNIATAASKFHGLLIAPGETFSMAQAMGDVSLDNGYTEALIILGDQTIKGVGGGVCQVSTTLFRAAFFTGFPIVERHAHAYRVSYYEKVAGNRIDPNLAGLDATVFVPLVDFRFTNDTPYWLLMETYVNPTYSTITWKFYSTSDGRTVEWTTTGPINQVDPPEPSYKENPDLAQGEIKQVDWAAEGADISVYRTVKKDGQVYFEDSYFTHFQPWQAKFEYGPGTELPEGASTD